MRKRNGQDDKYPVEELDVGGERLAFRACGRRS